MYNGKRDCVRGSVARVWSCTEKFGRYWYGLRLIELKTRHNLTKYSLRKSRVLWVGHAFECNWYRRCAFH